MHILAGTRERIQIIRFSTLTGVELQAFTVVIMLQENGCMTRSTGTTACIEPKGRMAGVTHY